MAWVSSSSKRKRSAAERASLERLSTVRQQREPFLDLSRQLVTRTCERYLPPDGSVIELGAGDGQLRERLPEAVLNRVMHTEPQPGAARAFRKRHHGVDVVRAGAEALPVADGGASAVIALCVLDVVSDGPAVARELHRVLRSGGRFIHWLDMSTLLTPVVATLAGTGLVPFPNVFGEPGAAEWPEDLFLVPADQLALIVSVLRQHNHEFGRPLGQYLARFSEEPFRPGACAAELVQLQDSAPLRQSLQTAFKAASTLADPVSREALAQFQGRPVSSARHFEQRLRHWFDEASGFRVEQSSVERVWGPISGEKPDFPYISCCVGEQRRLAHWPEILLSPNAEPGGQNATLAELGVFIFVASRI